MSLTLCHWLVPSVATILHNLLLGHISHYYVDAAYCYYRQSSVVCLSVSVGWSVTVFSPVKTAELIKMLFGLWTVVGPGNHFFSWRSRSPVQRDNFEGNTMSARQMAGWKNKINNSSKRIRAVEKRRTKCISVAGNSVEKWQKQNVIHISCDGLCQSMNVLNAPHKSPYLSKGLTDATTFGMLMHIHYQPSKAVVWPTTVLYLRVSVLETWLSSLW